MTEFSSYTAREFEMLVGNVLKDFGFKVFITKHTADGGVDIEARHEDLLFKGLYLIQCKHWSKNVGEPPIRDLYGVVKDRQAIKGILVTSSDFTNNAFKFSEGKNIELINGNQLLQLINEREIGLKQSQGLYSFIHNSNFNHEIYEMLINQIGSNVEFEPPYVSLLSFLLDHIYRIQEESKDNGLINELLYYTKIYERRFTRAKEKRSLARKIQVYYTLAYANFIKGDFVKTYELLSEMESGFNFKYGLNNSDGLPPRIYFGCQNLYRGMLLLLEIIDGSYQDVELYYPLNFKFTNKKYRHGMIEFEYKNISLNDMVERFNPLNVEDIDSQKKILQFVYDEDLFNQQSRPV